MKNKILFVFILTATKLICFGQNNLPNSSTLKDKINEVSVSVPFLWSKYAVTNQFGIYGSDKESKGDSWSTGINITYSRKIYKELFITGGFGYFKQNFDFSKSRTPASGSIRTTNSRPFLYNSQNQLLFSTTSYNYSNYQVIIGLGYKYWVNKNIRLGAILTYNQMNTFQQKYYPDKGNYEPQDNNNKNVFSKSFIFLMGGELSLTRSISTGLHILIPLSTKYKKDYIFMENINEYFTPKSCLGISISINYEF